MKRKLEIVPPPVERELDLAGDIYAKDRAAALDSDRWRRMHESAERREPLDLHQPAHKRTWASWGRRDG